MREYADVLVDAGIAAVAPNHRLTGTDTHPAQQDDIMAVLDWIASSADEYGFDPRRVGITGSSSGGHLTSLVGLKATRADAGPRGYTIRCMMPVCGPFDMVRRVAERPDSDVYHALFDAPTGEREQLIRDASPSEHVHPDAPPCLAVHGELDDTVSTEESANLVEALKAVGVQAELAIVPGMGHGRYQPDTDPPEPLGGAERFRAFFARHLLAAD